MEKERKNLVLFVLMIGFVFFTIYLVIDKKNVLSALKENYKREIMDSYQGIIIAKYVDKKNHNSSMVEFVDGTKRGIHPYFWGKIQIDDSISKVKGDSVIQVFRNGEKIILEIAPFYEKAIEEHQKK